MGVVATAPLLERSQELARIESALAEARTGHGRLVVIEGPAGIGKTALLAAARARAGEGGMRVLRSRATELERDFAFGIVRQLFEPPLAEASELERDDLLQGPAGVAAALLGFPGAAGEAPPQPAAADASFASLHGLYWLCVNLASSGPLCLAVDDAHWADAASLRYLAFLLSRVEELGVAVVAAVRPREPGIDAALLGAVTDDPSAEVIRPPPLTRAAVAQIVGARFGRPADPAFVDACLRATRGTPFLLRQLMDAVNEEGVAPTAEAARNVERIGAQTIGRSIRVRLRRLPERAGRLAGALAILEQGDLSQTARLAGLTEEEAADAADLLAATGMLEAGRPLTFIHPVVRTGIYSELSEGERNQGHRRAARLLADRPGANERVAQHLLASEPAADGWVVERLAEAADAARRKGAPDLEAVYLRRAIEEPPAAEDLPHLVLQLGIAEAGGGLEGWDEHLGRAVEIAPTPGFAAHAASALGRALYRGQRFTEAVDVLDRAAALPGLDAELSQQLQATALSFGADLFDVSPSVVSRRKALRDQARAHPEAPPDVLGAAAFLSVLANEPAQSAAELAVLAVQRLAAGGDRKRVDASFGFFARMVSALSLLLTDRYEHLDPLMDAWIAAARASADSGVLAGGLAIRGWLELRRGQLSAAEADTRMALSTELPAPAIYRILNRAVLVETLVDAGDLAAAEEELTWLEPELDKGPLFGSLGRLARGRLRIEQGRVAEALEDFRTVGTDLARAQILSPVWADWRSEAALASLLLGEHGQAETLAREELELAHAFGSPRAVGVAKRVAGVVAGGERGELLLRAAVDALGRGEYGLERARALADLGAMLRRGNRRTEARVLLRDALDAAHRAGARLLAERAETELRATGARPRRVLLTGLDSLTASERRIAELAGGGLTNREIAQMLFVTARTVEGHLTSVFRKLQLDSRDELPAALTEAAPVPA
jgi:DNA-binding CsgD family transcriptional regulator/tetratricopeptide (TPR) repeat protein